jgi:hypothetical protein
MFIRNGNRTYVDSRSVWNGIDGIIKEFQLNTWGWIVVVIGKLYDRGICAELDMF